MKKQFAGDAGEGQDDGDQTRLGDELEGGMMKQRQTQKKK